jgi:hypothetical protein
MERIAIISEAILEKEREQELKRKNEKRGNKKKREG